MAPIHESDLGEERWSKVEWENYELWEKVEQRLRRKKNLAVLATVMVFTVLSAVPIVGDRWPKWTTRTFARRLAQELNWIKSQASVHRSAYRFKLLDPNKLDYAVERLSNCNQVQGEVVKTGSLARADGEGYVSITPAVGETLAIPGLVTEFCYDSLKGSGQQSLASTKEVTTAGLAFIPVRDLTEKRLDRVSVLLFTGTSAEFSFD